MSEQEKSIGPDEIWGLLVDGKVHLMSEPESLYAFTSKRAARDSCCLEDMPVLIGVNPARLAKAEAEIAFLRQEIKAVGECSAVSVSMVEPLASLAIRRSVERYGRIKRKDEGV